MGRSVYRTEAATSKSSLFVLCFLCVFICASSLGTLRLYGLYLEHRIAQTTNRIEQYKEDNSEMSKRFSELLSPARIYSYAREELGMVNAENITTVRLPNTSLRAANEPVQVADARTTLGLLDYLNPFLSRAHAKN